jgi:uncharacterized membrane protein YeaQ/YmgE (transglycosylase-associated protein family)
MGGCGLRSRAASPSKNSWRFIMGWLSWILFGLIAGVVAKLLVPGPNPGGCLLTIVIGIVGAAIGGFIGTQLGWGVPNEFDFRSLGLAVIGAIVLLLALRALSGGPRSDI